MRPRQPGGKQQLSEVAASAAIVLIGNLCAIPSPYLRIFKPAIINVLMVLISLLASAAPQFLFIKSEERLIEELYLLELATNLREDFTITEKAPLRAFSLLKLTTGAFTFKTLC